jgi:hypothetical protein
MAYAVTRNDPLQLVDVRYFDCVSVEQRGAAMDETLAILRATGIRRIAIDYAQARLRDDPVATMSAFATRIATNAALRQCHIAFIGKAGHQFNITVETLSSARGYGARRFFDRDSALAWLQGQPLAVERPAPAARAHDGASPR